MAEDGAFGPAYLHALATFDMTITPQFDQRHQPTTKTTNLLNLISIHIKKLAPPLPLDPFPSMPTIPIQEQPRNRWLFHLQVAVSDRRIRTCLQVSQQIMKQRKGHSNLTNIYCIATDSRTQKRSRDETVQTVTGDRFLGVPKTI